MRYKLSPDTQLTWRDWLRADVGWLLRHLWREAKYRWWPGYASPTLRATSHAEEDAVVAQIAAELGLEEECRVGSEAWRVFMSVGVAQRQSPDVERLRDRPQRDRQPVTAAYIAEIRARRRERLDKKGE